MKHINNFNILVNTCDAYEDCWDPFFKLFALFWPEYKGKIYLNTERKNYSFGKLNIIPIQGCKNDKIGSQTSWSIRFKRALEAIDNNIILYLQDDYFIKDFVKYDFINDYADLMIKNKDIDCIHLTDQATLPESGASLYKGLFPTQLHQRYLVCLQAALWKKDVLFQYIKTKESIWEFEEFASKRGARLKHNFYTVDRGWIKLNKFEIIPYIFTGITQGSWNEEVIPLFKIHQIEINFEKRGFVNEIPKRTLKMKLIGKWKRIPILIDHYIDILKLKS